MIHSALERLGNLSEVSSEDFASHDGKVLEGTFQMDRVLGMGQLATRDKRGSGRRGLNLIEGAHDGAGLGGAIVVGIDHVSAEGILLRPLLAVDIVILPFRDGVLEDIQYTGL